MGSEPKRAPGAGRGTALRRCAFEALLRWGNPGAGVGTRGVVSSRFAAPSLRYGPSGDTTPRVPRSFTMAVSELPAMADRRTHLLHPTPSATPHGAERSTTHHGRIQLPRLRTDTPKTAILIVANRKNSCRQAERGTRQARSSFQVGSMQRSPEFQPCRPPIGAGWRTHSGLAGSAMIRLMSGRCGALALWCSLYRPHVHDAGCMSCHV